MIGLNGSWTGSGDNRPRDFAGGSAEDVTVREYRRGDDLRRVHWRASAHAGELMVRREEQPWQSRATVFIDNRAHVHRGTGAASSLEYAVSAAASIAAHLVQRGFRTRLISASGTSLGEGWHEAGATATDTGPLLEALAVLAPESSQRLDALGPDETHSRGLRGRRSSATSPPPTRPWSTGCATRPRAPSRWSSTWTAGRARRGASTRSLPACAASRPAGGGRCPSDRRTRCRRKWREVGLAVRRTSAGERVS